MSGLIANRYRIDSLLEYGGTVYQAFDVELGRSVALKMIPGRRPAEPELFERFQQQAAAAARLVHPNVVRIYDVTEHKTSREGIQSREPVIVMEFVPGKNLAHYLRHREALPSESLIDPFDQKLEVLIQVCKGLHHGHEQGLVHGAINPQNIRITPTGEPRILNFGMTPLTAPAIPRYLSPEQLDSNAGIDRRSDVFSLGVVLYELLALAPPFEAEPSGGYRPIEEHLPGAAPELIDLVNRSLARDPGDRLPDCRAFEAILKQVRQRFPGPKERGGAAVDGESERWLKETLASARSAGEEGYFEWGLALLDDLLKSDPENEEATSLKETFLAARQRREKAADLVQQAREAQAAGEVAAASLLALEAWKLDPRSSDAEKVFEQSQAVLRGKREGKPADPDNRMGRVRNLSAVSRPVPALAETEDQASERAEEAAEPPAVEWADMGDQPRSRYSRFSRLAIPILALGLLAGGVWLASRDDTGPAPVTAGPTVSEPAAPGTVSLDIVPWSKVEAIVRVSDGQVMEHGDLETPCVLSLPAGEYLLTVSHPDFGSHRLPIDVRSGEVSSVEYSLLSMQEMQKELAPGAAGRTRP